ncbi:MAG: ABC transporter permease [Dehalococcoidales bacterium]|nr:ABC transporter permease [Dehalococcoidales bacterium]
MIDQIRAELFKLRKRSMSWIMIIVLAAFFCLIFFSIYGITANPPERIPDEAIQPMRTLITFPDAFKLIFSTAQSIGAILLTVIVASSMGNEYGWSTIKQVMTRKGIRYQYILSKLVSFIVYALIGIIIAFIIGFCLALITTRLVNGGFNWDFITASYIGELFTMYGWTFYGLFVYVLLAILLSLVGRSAIVGIGGTLGYYFVESIAISIFNQSGGWLAEIPNYLIGHNISAILPTTMMQGPFTSSGALPSTLYASIVLAIYCIVFLVLSLYIFKKRDITV